MRAIIYKVSDENNELIDYFINENEAIKLVEDDDSGERWIEELAVDSIFCEWDDLEQYRKESYLINSENPRCPNCGYMDDDFYLETDNPNHFEEECPLCDKTYRVYGEIKITYCSEEI